MTKTELTFFETSLSSLAALSVISLMREWGSLTNSESADSSSSVVIVRTTKLRGINPRKLLALKIM